MYRSVVRLASDIARFASLLAPEKGRYARGLAALAAVDLMEVASPLVVAVAIDLLAGGARRGAGAPQVLSWLGLRPETWTFGGALALYLVLALVSNLLRYPMLTQVSIPSHRIGQRLRNDIARRLLRLSRPFYDRAPSGGLMSIATADVQAVRMFLGIGLLLLVDTALLLTLVLAAMFALSPALALASIAPLPLIALFTNRFSRAEFDRFGAVQEDLARLTDRARESFAGIRVVQGYAREETMIARFARASRRHFGLNLRLARLRSLFDPSLDLMIGLSAALAVAVGGVQFGRGAISVGTLVAFLYLVANLSGPMVGFGWAVSLLQRGRASLARIDALLAEPVEIADAPDAVEPQGAGALEVRGLTFSYAGAAAPALADLSFALPAGRRLGVVGPVGAGKSTLVALLVRLYDPPPGTVFLDGVDVRRLTLGGLRRVVSLAPQEAFLFGDTVERNVRAGGGDDAPALAALAAIDDEIERLPERYATLLGERGVNLSGGQRQRIALARAIGAEPRILILDDALAAVDAATEAKILANLERVFAGRGGIVVSHRVRAVERCDEIIVLERGRIADRGTHDELLARGGWYADVARRQAQAGADGDAR
ncbi:MAG: ABC transporter ATP-binding protein [Candidatus Polarisedimenticolia bacterium]